MKWLEVKIETDIDVTEYVSMLLIELGATGTNIQNPEEIKKMIDKAGAKELADYDDFAEQLSNYSVTAYFNTESDINSIESKIRNSLEDEFKFSWREVDDNSWKGNWKKFYKPFMLTNTLKIIPSWENGNIDEKTIIMDPGMAFGTGTHETTSMCAFLIEELMEKGYKVLDIGTGTGILSIVASKLGAASILAIDIDPIAVKTAKMNLKENNIENVVVELGELKHFEKNGFDLIVANIVSDVLIDISADMKARLRKGGCLVCSGIIQERENDVVKALENAGFKNAVMTRKNEWTAIKAYA